MKRKHSKIDQEQSSPDQATTSTESLSSVSSGRSETKKQIATAEPFLEETGDWSDLSSRMVTRLPKNIFSHKDFYVFDYKLLRNGYTQLDTSHGKFTFHQLLATGSHGEIFLSDLPSHNSFFLVVKKFIDDSGDKDQKDKNYKLDDPLKEWYFYNKLGYLSLLYVNKKDHQKISSYLRSHQKNHQGLLPFILEKTIKQDNPHMITPYLGDDFSSTLERYTQLLKERHPVLKMNPNDRADKIVILSLLRLILESIGDLHKKNIIHYDAKVLNFVFYHTPNGNLNSRAVDFPYSIDLTEKSGIFIDPLTVEMADRNYFSRITTRDNVRQLLCRFIDFYALFIFMAKTSMLPPPLKNWFGNMSTCRIIELIDYNSHKSNYAPNNFWVCAMHTLTSTDLQTCVRVELNALKNSPISSNNSIEIFSTLLVWILGLVVDRTIHRQLKIQINHESRSFNFQLQEQSEPPLNCLLAHNLKDLLSFNAYNPGIFSQVTTKNFYDRISLSNDKRPSLDVSFSYR